jgi:HD-like signal output (HDOD) protein
VRLGSKSLEELVVSTFAASLFHDVTGAGRFYRDHCAGTAAIARVLADELATRCRDGIFLCGLLHDLGKLLLLQAGGTVYKQTLDATDMREPDRIHLHERATLGYDHAVLGGLLLKKWKIPEPIPSVVALHHRPDPALGSPAIGPMVALLRLADHLEPSVARPVPDVFGLCVEDLAGSRELEVLDVSEAALPALWDKLQEVRAQTIELIKGLGS